MDSRVLVLGGTAAVATVGSVAGILLLGGREVAAGCKPFVRAPVPAAAKEALAAYRGEIKHDVGRAGGAINDESWTDPLTGRTRQVEYSAGRVVGVFAVVPSGGYVRTINLNVGSHAWISNRFRQPGGASRREPNEAASLAQANRDDVANGRATIVGREVVDGTAALHLHRVQTFPAPTAKSMHLPKGFQLPAQALRPPPPITIDTWVDPLTYVTLRMRSTINGHASTSDESWLPRTPSNVAKTRLRIPPGFRHLVPQTGTAYASNVALRADGCS